MTPAIRSMVARWAARLRDRLDFDTPESQAVAVLLLHFHLSPCELAGEKKECPIVQIPCGCDAYLDGKPCLCDPQFEHCPHTRALWDNWNGPPSLRIEGAKVTVDRFAAERLFPEAEPEEYFEPPAPPYPAIRSTKKAEHDCFNARAQILYPDQAPRYSLRHPDDILPNEVDVIEEQAELGKVRGELVIPFVRMRQVEDARKEAEEQEEQEHDEYLRKVLGPWPRLERRKTTHEIRKAA